MGYNVMKRIVTLTAFAVAVVLSPAAFAHGIKAGSGGSASGWASTGWGGFAATNQVVSTKTSATRFGVQTYTKASSTSIAAADFGPVAVGGSASAGSGGSVGH